MDFSSTALAACMAAFGSEVLYSPQSGGSYTLTGVIDKVFLAEDIIADGSMTAGHPSHVSAEQAMIGIRIADCPCPPIQGDRLSWQGQTYQVQEVRHDGQGGAHLVLNFENKV